jgi:hypothetical protein
MSERTVRANARALPEAASYPDANIRALAAQYEAALQAYHAFYHGSGTDDEAAAATDAVKAVAQKIIAVPGTDISIMRLKARVYLWAEDTDLEKLAAEGGDWPSEAVLASLFRDLGVADLEATPGPATMADRAPAQHEEARLTEAPATEEPDLQALIAAWQETSRRLEETYEASCAAADRARLAEQKAAQERERVAEAKAVWGQAVDDYHAMGARVAKLRATTMAGVIAKLLASAPHVTEDELEDDAHSAVLAGAALDAQALAQKAGEARA